MQRDLERAPQWQVQEEEQEEEQEQEQEEEQQQEEEVEREDEEVQERNTIDDREVFETVELMWITCTGSSFGSKVLQRRRRQVALIDTTWHNNFDYNFAIDLSNIDEMRWKAF